MPWVPELFSVPAQQRALEKYRRERMRLMPFFDGLLTGEIDALVDSFSGVPEVHHPVRGRIRGEAAFRHFVADMTAWLAARNGSIEHVGFLITDPRGVEEVVVHLEGERGRIGLPLALAADHDQDERIVELRLYFSAWSLTGRHANRPPLLQPDLALHLPDVVGEHQRALANGDVDAILAAFEPDGHLREPAGDVHRGPGELRAHYARCFSNGGGIPLEDCALTDNGRACALEYNVVAWGRTEPPPAAGIAVYVRRIGRPAPFDCQLDCRHRRRGASRADAPGRHPGGARCAAPKATRSPGIFPPPPSSRGCPNLPMRTGCTNLRGRRERFLVEGVARGPSLAEVVRHRYDEHGGEESTDDAYHA